MIVERRDERRSHHLTAACLIGAACFIVGCLANLALIWLAGEEGPNLADPLSFLPIVLPLLDSILVVVFLCVSFELGWQATRCFWIVVGLACLFGWVLGDLLPVLLAPSRPGWASFARWCGPALVALLLVVSLLNPRRPAEIWRPVEAIMHNGRKASTVVAVATSLRIGLFAYSLPQEMNLQETRVQHVPAPAEYATLTNPFEHPQSCVVLEQVGDDPEAVQEVVRAAVPNRTDARTADLVRHVPIVIREVADRALADEIAGKLRGVGANASIRDALDMFVELVETDAPTPIGRPSQVLDDEYLRTGRDSLVDLRTAIAATPKDAPADHELVKRAYIAFATAQGRALYQVNCRPCHGTKGSGDGPMASGFSLRPANFRDPNGIGMLKPGEMLWRIEEGGSALPRESTPWDSSMPAWRHELDRELVWKIILGEFNTANAQPAAQDTAAHHHSQPVSTVTKPKVADPSWLSWPVPPEPTPEQLRDPEFIKAGGYLYYYRCMPCHGVTGRGDGPAADTMWPRPRDFTTENFGGNAAQPKFKFRTTKSGWLPLDQDLYRTISRGLTGTAMEGWNGVLAPQEIWQIITYIKTLSSAWNDPEHNAKNPYDPVIVEELSQFDPSPPAIDYGALKPPHVAAQLVAEGRDAFLRSRCYECHGVEARGDGGALGQNYDDWGYRMWPQNLANPLNYKAGYTSKEIYRSFANRLDGTVMPTFSANTLDPEDPVHGEYLQWALAAYVSDQVRSRAGMTDARKVVARQLSGNLPSDPSDPAWEQIPMRVVPLSGQVLVPPRWSAPSVSQVAIRVVFNSTAMAVWLRWDDRRPNVVHEEPSVDFAAASDPMLGPATYAAPALKPKSPVVFNARDQLELQLPDPAIEQRALQDRPQFFYGSEQAPVRLWRWSADRQGLKVTKRVEEIAGAKAERFECTSETPERNEGAIDLLIARGLAQIEPVSNGPVIRSRADWSNGAWTLVLSGSLVEPQQLLSDRRALPIAIHLWDGLAGETGLRMAISSWIDIVAASPRPIWQHAVAVVLAALVLIGLLMLARRMRLHFSLSGRASDG